MNKILRAVSNEIRLKIISYISVKERSVGEIINCLGSITQSAVSQHLSILREAEIVEIRRDKQTIYYRISEKSKKEIEDLVRAISKLMFSIEGY